jgi:uncharacterized damage-inducible protein DinB
MLDMIQSLYAHQAWADAMILGAIAKHEPAAADDSLRKTLHHIVTVQRAFHSLFVKRPFDFVVEMQAPESLEEVEQLFRSSHAEGIALVNQRQASELSLPFEMPYIPGAKLNNGQAHLQVVMHSQHHRGQCATRFRALGGVPPTVDYIIWLKDRPVAWA